jgi:hypothetical protein
MVSESSPPFDRLSHTFFLGRAIESPDEQSLSDTTSGGVRIV